MFETSADTYVVEKIPQLARLGNVVPEGYEYSEKLVTPGKDINLPNAYLKWYDIRYPDLEISPALVEESQTFLEEEVARLKFEGELGFVLLHMCGPIMLLLLMTWRQTNEIWESVYVKDLRRPGGYEPLKRHGSHLGTFCVWELGPVWHERNAWMRFLSSNRDEKAKLAYVNDRFSGVV